MPIDYSGTYTSDDWDAVMSVLDDGVPHITLGGTTRETWPSGGGSASVGLARRTADFSPSTTGSYVKVPLDSSVTMSGSVSFSNGSLTVSESGLWQVSASADLEKEFNGMRVQNVTQGVTLGLATTSTGMATVPAQPHSMTDGDVLELQVNLGLSGHAVFGGVQTFLEVTKL